MKGNMTWLRLALMLFVTLLLLALCDKCYSAACECRGNLIGCTISSAAPAGFKCRCTSNLFTLWCQGSAFPCVGNEQCPGNQADYCACQLGKGLCGAYLNPPTTCKGSGTTKIDVAGSAQCSCHYNPGGCTISKPAPFGWKCICVYKGFWTCRGWAQQCNANEVCLGGDYSYCGCMQGSGSCGGYPDKPSCPSRQLSTSCNCNRARDWNKGLYTIDHVTYDLKNIQTHPMKPIVLHEKNIRNHSGKTQSGGFSVSESMHNTSSFSNTRGIMISAGIDFKVGIPYIGETSVSSSITNSFEHTYGKTESTEKVYQNTFTCNGAPYKHTKCIVTMSKAKVTVPYTMSVKHKIISDCTCESYGVWTGIQAYNAQFKIQEMEN